jgi:hypothetical protein
MMINVFLAFVLSLSICIPVHAFGDLGHKMVAAIAWQQLTPYAKQNIQRILGPGEKTFVNASTWADHIKGNESFNYLKPMHYVNMPKDASRYDRKRDCRKDRCVVQAIDMFSQVLTSGKEKNKKLALRMVIHLLGDIHQPLHAGLRIDRGGNWYEVNYEGKDISLHKLWDHQLVKRLKLDWQQAAKQLTLGNLQVELADPKTWAEESHQITINTVYNVGENAKVNDAYLKVADEIVKNRIIKAGWRLGMWLNKMW